MSPSVVASVDTFTRSFSTRSLPAQRDLTAVGTPQVTRLGAHYIAYPTHSVKPPKARRFGHVANKTRAVATRALLTPEDLATQIRTRYAYLLKATDDGYVIDMTSLSEIKMRKRYRSLGCTVRVARDLTTAEVVPVDSAVPATALTKLATVALAVYTLLREDVLKLWSVVAPSFTSEGDVALFPFQSGIGDFLKKIDTFLLGAKGILFHLTGMDYTSMLQWLKKQLDTTDALVHTLPTDTAALGLTSLPLVKLGVEYYNHFKTYVEDALAKGQVTRGGIDAVTAKSALPNAWTAVEKLAYPLWSLSYYHTVTSSSVQDTLLTIGSVLSLKGQTLFEGILSVVRALQALFSFKGTSLVGASEVISNPTLARKFITLNELVSTDNAYADVRAFAPSKISISPV